MLHDLPILRFDRGEQYKLWWTSLCSLLQLPTTSFLLGPNIPSAPCSKTFTMCVPPIVWETRFYPHTKQVQLYLIQIYMGSLLLQQYMWWLGCHVILSNRCSILWLCTTVKQQIRKWSLNMCELSFAHLCKLTCSLISQKLTVL